MAKIGSLTADLRLESAAFMRDMKAATNAIKSNTAQMNMAMRGLQRSASAVQRQFSQLRSGFAALAGALAVRRFALFTKTAIESGGAIQDVAEKVGLTTTALQQLRFAAAQFGVRQNALDMGMQRFSRRLGEAAIGSGELKGTLELYGIQVKDSEGRTRAVVDVLGDLADAVKNAASDQERLRIAFKAFDSEGAALVNMLRDGKVGLERFMQQAIDFGAVMSREVVAQSKIASDNLTTLGAIAQTAFNTAIVKQFAGSLVLTKENMLSVREAAENFGRLVGMAMKVVAETAKVVGRNIREIVAALAALAALKVAGLFVSMAGAVITFSRALIAAARSGALLNAVLSKSVLGAVASVVIALGAGAATYAAFGDEIKKVAASVEELSGTIGSTSNLLDDDTKKRQEAIRNIRIQASEYRSLTMGLRMGEEAHRAAEESIEVENAARQHNIDLQSEQGRQLRQAFADMQSARRGYEDLAERMQELGRLGEDVGASIAGAFESAIFEGKKFKDVLKALGQDLARLAFRQFVAQPLINSFGNLFAGFAHQGGVAGSTATKPVPAAAFAGAGRMHNGGIAGLQSNEVPMILKKGEPVFRDMEHAREVVGGGMNLTYSPQIDARGADAGAVARLERALLKDRQEFDARVVQAVRRGRKDLQKGIG